MAGKRLTRFQREVIEKGEIDMIEILRAFGDRLLANAGYPPVLPVAGQELHGLLDELEEALDAASRTTGSDSDNAS